jgi:hypothetical protein
VSGGMGRARRSPKKSEIDDDAFMETLAQIGEMLKNGAWNEATGEHFVALYADLHYRTYQVLTDDLGPKERAFAIDFAEKMLSKQFGDDRDAMARFIAWTWTREKEPEQWRRENGRDAGRITWRTQFGASLLTDYKTWCARKGKPLPTPGDESETVESRAPSPIRSSIRPTAATRAGSRTSTAGMSDSSRSGGVADVDGLVLGARTCAKSGCTPVRRTRCSRTARARRGARVRRTASAPTSRRQDSTPRSPASPWTFTPPAASSRRPWARGRRAGAPQGAHEATRRATSPRTATRTARWRSSMKPSAASSWTCRRRT